MLRFVFPAISQPEKAAREYVRRSAPPKTWKMRLIGPPSFVRVVRFAFPAAAREVAPGPAPALERDLPEREEQGNDEEQDDHPHEMRNVRDAAREPHAERRRRLPGLGLGLEAQDPAPGGNARHEDAAVLAAFAPALAPVDARVAVRDQIERADFAGGL